MSPKSRSLLDRPSGKFDQKKYYIHITQSCIQSRKMHIQNRIRMITGQRIRSKHKVIINIQHIVFILKLYCFKNLNIQQKWKQQRHSYDQRQQESIVNLLLANISNKTDKLLLHSMTIRNDDIFGKLITIIECNLLSLFI